MKYTLFTIPRIRGSLKNYRLSRDFRTNMRALLYTSEGPGSNPLFSNRTHYNFSLGLGN